MEWYCIDGLLVRMRPRSANHSLRLLVIARGCAAATHSLPIVCRTPRSPAALPQNCGFTTPLL